MWRELTEELQEHVAAAHADASLTRDYPHGAPDLSDRRESLSERIVALCDEMDSASCGSQKFDRILAVLGATANSSIQSDLSELKKLSALKRIPDLRKHDYSVARHIAHIRLLADQLHHFAA
jgi:hypothetical protein